MKSVVVSGKCYRIGCTDLGSRSVRDRSGKVISFCSSCWYELLKFNVIDRETGQVMTT